MDKCIYLKQKYYQYHFFVTKILFVIIFMLFDYITKNVLMYIVIMKI